MGTTTVKNILAGIAKRKSTISTEDKDVNITIDQENEIETDALADAVEQTDKNVNPDAGQLNATSDDEDGLSDVAQAQQIDEMAAAVQGLENIKLHIRNLKNSRTPISTATLEALQLAVDNTLISVPKTKRLVMPSVESVAIDTRGELSKLESNIVVSQEGLLDSIGNAWSNMFVSMYDSGKVKGMKSVFRYLDKYDGEASKFENIQVGGSTLSDPETLEYLRGVTSHNLSDTLSKISNVNADFIRIAKDRIPQVEAEVEIAIGRIVAGEDLGYVSERFQQALTDVLVPDGTSVVMHGSTMWQSIRSVLGKSYKVSGWHSEDNYAKQASAHPPVLTSKAIYAVSKELRGTLNVLIPHFSNEKARRKQVAASINAKLADAIKGAETNPDISKNIKRTLEEAKVYLGYINGIESAILGNIYWGIWAIVWYISESLSTLEFIKDPAKVKAEIERRHREEMDALREELELERERSRNR